MNCPKCGSSNPPGAKFCNQCGAELREVVYRKRGREQRRRVAIMFADISGFTALSESLDPEEVKELIDNCLQRLSGQIYRYEGYIDKFIGDCIMALFGAPLAHEDDPLRAAISAIDLMKEIEKFNKENKTNLALSIGINYGMVATGDLGRPGEYTVMGDTVNLAQRLQHAAPRGKIFVSESVVEQTRDEITYKKLEAIKVKGKAEKVLVFEPQKVKRTYSLRRIKELRLIGRQHELKKLSDIFSKVKARHGQVVSIVGEAGIGKSKLMYEWKKSIADGIYILEGKGFEYLKTSSYLVLKDVLRELFGIGENDAQAVASAKLMHFIKGIHDSSLKKAIPFLKYFLSMALSVDDYNRFESMKAGDRVRMINEAIRLLILKVSCTKTMVIVFEDCHWIDPETMDFMHRLAKRISDKSIMIINLYRPEFNIGKTSRLSYFSRINLKPLAPDDTIALLYDLFRCKKIEPKLVTLLLEKSGRIPFYIHELATNLFSTNVIYIEDKVAKLKHGMESAVPRSLDELVMSKIDKLDIELRAVVDIASVIGDEFSVAVLNELLQLNGKLKAHLRILEQQDIIQPVADKRDLIAADVRYRFIHSITRDAIYDSLLKRHRKDYHKKVGYAIEKVFGDSLDEFYDALANHFLIGEEKEKAVEYVEKAGDRKKELYLNDDAIALYKRGLELIEKSKKTIIARIYEKLGGIYALIGQYNNAINAYQEMRHYGKGNKLLKVRSSYAMADVARKQGLFDQAISQLDKSRHILKIMKKSSPAEVKMELANILSLECWIYRIKGKMNEAEKKGLKAIETIKAVKYWQDHGNLKSLLEKAYFALSTVYYIKGEYEKAIHFSENILLIAEELGHRQGLGGAYNNLGMIYQDQGRYGQAINAYNMKLEISEELGDKKGIGDTYCNLGITHQNRGEFEEAIKLYGHSLRIAEELCDKHGIGRAHVNLGVVYWYKGEYERAIKSFETYLKISEELGDKMGIAVALGNLGEVYETQFRYEKAIELYKKYLKISEKLGSKRSIGIASDNLGKAYTVIGKLSEAEKYLNSAKDIFETTGNKFAIGNIYNSISYLKLKQSKLTEALNNAIAALKLAKETGAPGMEVRAFVNIGRIYYAQSRSSSPEKAKSLLKKSKEGFKEAIKLAQGLKDRRLLASAYYEFANTLKSGNKSDKNMARKNFKEALKIYKTLDLRYRTKEITNVLKKLK